MKKNILLLFSILVGFFLFPGQLFAFEHGYKINTGNIYAMVRNDIPVYYSNDGENLKTYLPSFSGITVIDSAGSWYQVEYKTKSGMGTGWVTKEEFTYDCLVYDGTEKQIVANGTYQLRYCQDVNGISILNSMDDSNSFSNHRISCKIKFLGNKNYQIYRTDTGKYLLADQLFESNENEIIWGSEQDAGTFHLIRKGNYYGIQDSVTNRYLGTNDAGLLSFTNGKNIYWRLNRTNKAVSKSSLRVFVQFDPEWASTHYGRGKNEDPSTNNYCTSACGIFSTINAIYSLTGHYVNPDLLADYAVEKYYRIEGYGTDSGFFKAAASKFGYKYGFRYDGSGESLKQLKDKLNKGDTAIAYVPGHYVAIVDYDKKKNKFLLLDPHYLPKRRTSSFGDWVSEKDLEEGALFAQMFFYYKQIDY